MLDEKQFINSFKQKFRSSEKRNQITHRTPESVIHSLATKALNEKKFELGYVSEIPELKINRKKKDLAAFFGRAKREAKKNQPKPIIHNVKKTPKDDWRVEYERYINSKAWRDVRQKYRADSTRYQDCWSCMAPANSVQIHFHHLHYNSLMHETLDDIIPLCVECHKNLHHKYDIAKAKKRSLSLKKFSMDFCKNSEKIRNPTTE